MTNPISDLQTRLAAATRARIRDEHARDTAVIARDAACKELRDEFGVTTAEQAQQLLDGMRADLQRMIADINATLDGLEQ